MKGLYAEGNDPAQGEKWVIQGKGEKEGEEREETKAIEGEGWGSGRRVGVEGRLCEDDAGGS